MPVDNNAPDLFRGVICLNLSIGCEEDPSRLGLSAPVDRLLVGASKETVSSVELAEAICSGRRMWLPELHGATATGVADGEGRITNA